MFAQVVIMITAIFFVVSIFVTPLSVYAQPLLPDVAEDESSDTVDTTSGIPQINNTNSSSQQNQTQNTIAGSGAFTPNTPLLPVCGIGITASTGSIEGCIVRGVYYLFLYPSAWLASMGGNVFDWFIGYTLSSDSYSQADFVEKGWRIVRDIANLSFIFVLLYIAFRFVLGLEGRDVQKTLIKIIGIALVINFSLFATRLIIDAGNILGRVFYERITVTGAGEGSTGYTPLSVGLISKVNPQRLLSSGMFAPTASITATTGQENNTLGELNDGASGASLNSTGFQILVLLTAAGVNLVLAYVFFSVGIFFVARTIGLWFQMIFSPIAFLSVAVPKVGSAGGGRFEFSKWLATTFSLSFMVVVFMFLLYLTIMFLGVAFGSLIDAGENSSGLTLFLEVLIPFIVVALLLLAAQKQAKEMSGEFGTAMVSGLKKGLMLAVGGAGLALGGAALVGGAVGRQTAGRLASSKWANKEAKTGWGRARVNAAKRLQNSTFDTRNVKIPKPLTSGLRSGLSYATGGEMKAGDFAVNMNRLGGPSSKTYKSVKEQRIKEKTDKAKNYAAGEDSTMRDVKHEYEIEETSVNASGNVFRTKRTVKEAQDKISLAEAKKKKREAEVALEEKKVKIHSDENYLDKKRELEKREKDQEKLEKAYNDLLNKKKAGIPVSSTALSNAQSDLVREKARVKYQKEQVKQVEDMYQTETNEVAKFASMIEATKRAVNAKNAEIYNNYAQSLEDWAPPQSYNYRGPANRGAASNVRDMANREEDKSK